MSKRITRNVVAALTAGCLITLSTSEAWAQRGGTTRGSTGRGGSAGQASGSGENTIGAVGGTTQPSSAITGEISRSSDRMLSDAGEQAGGAGAAGLGGMRGLGGMGGMGMGGFGGMSPFGASPFGASTVDQTPRVRVRLRSDVQVPAQPPRAVQSRVQRQVLVNSPIQRRVNGMAVSVLDGVATLTGTANSEQDRRMAELVLRLEPGVRQINNQIVVAP